MNSPSLHFKTNKIIEIVILKTFFRPTKQQMSYYKEGATEACILRLASNSGLHFEVVLT